MKQAFLDIVYQASRTFTSGGRETHKMSPTPIWLLDADILVSGTHSAELWRQSEES